MPASARQTPPAINAASAAFLLIVPFFAEDVFVVATGSNWKRAAIAAPPAGAAAEPWEAVFLIFISGIIARTPARTQERYIHTKQNQYEIDDFNSLILADMRLLENKTTPRDDKHLYLPTKPSFTFSNIRLLFLIWSIDDNFIFHLQIPSDTSPLPANKSMSVNFFFIFCSLLSTPNITPNFAYSSAVSISSMVGSFSSSVFFKTSSNS